MTSTDCVCGLFFFKSEEKDDNCPSLQNFIIVTGVTGVRVLKPVTY